MITAIVVDDRPEHIKLLTILIEEHCKDVALLAKCENVENSLLAIKRYNPDIVFLDIVLKNEIGFDLLKTIGVENINFDVIFTTAHNQYAVNAFEFCALDFLLKPINIKRLRIALNKVRSTWNEKAKLETLLQNYNYAAYQKKRIIITYSLKMEVLKLEEIVYIFFMDKSTKVVSIKRDAPFNDANRTIKEYTQLLSAFGFFKIHPSCLINLNYVDRIKRDEQVVVVKNKNTKTELGVSRRNFPLLIKALAI